MLAHANAHNILLFFSTGSVFLNGKNWGICSRFPQVLRTTAAPEPIHPPGGRGAKISKAARLQDHAPGKARENAENPTRARRRICRAPVSCLADTKGGGVTQYPPPANGRRKCRKRRRRNATRRGCPVKNSIFARNAANLSDALRRAQSICTTSGTRNAGRLRRARTVGGF